MSKPVLFCDFLDIDSATTTANNDGSVNRVRHSYKTLLSMYFEMYTIMMRVSCCKLA